MGNACCGTSIADGRPQLKVTIGSAAHLPHLDCPTPEIEAYVQLRYGPLNGSRNDSVKKSAIIKTDRSKATWNQILHLPAPSLKVHYSLEISVWDKDLVGPDDYCGRAIVHFADHAGNRKSTKFDKMESKRLLTTEHVKDFLPTEWNQCEEYDLQLEHKDPKTGEWQGGGSITITCEFVQPQNAQHNTQPAMG